jgi:hypothetical protein
VKLRTWLSVPLRLKVFRWQRKGCIALENDERKPVDRDEGLWFDVAGENTAELGW